METEVHQDKFELIPLAQLKPSPYQYRKTFDDLDELAASIKKSGLLTPIRARPNGGEHLEIVYGERRWRASKLAGVDAIPVLVRDMTDDEAIEALFLENLQRKDVQPLEEAEGFQAALNRGYTIEQLMSKTQRSRAHIYARLKLTTLAPGVRKALASGKLGSAIAEMIGTIGDTKLQEQACKEILGSNLDWQATEAIAELGIQHEACNEDSKQPSNDDNRPLSWRAAKALIRRRYMTKLALAKFDTNDATLTPAGSCGPCPHRSGNQPQLPGVDDGKADDALCTKPSCFEAKTHAAWKKQAAEAEARGLEVVEAKDAKDVFGHDGVSIARGSKYVEPDGELPPELMKAPGKAPTWSKLLGKHLEEVPRVLVQDESGAPRELLDKAAAVKKARELGKLAKSEPAKKPSSSSRESHALASDRNRDDRDMREAVAKKLTRDVLTEASKLAERKELAWWRWLANYLLGFSRANISNDGELLTILEVDKKKPWAKQLIEKANTTAKVRQLITGVLYESMIEDGALFSPLAKDDELRVLLELLNIDFDAAMKREKQVAAAAAAPKQSTDDGKRCGVVNGKKDATGCIHAQGHDGSHSNGRQTWSDPKPKAKAAKKGGRK